MSDADPIQLLEHIIAMAKWRREAGHKLTWVRRIDETDMGTLERLVEDHKKLYELAYQHADTRQRMSLDDKFRGALPRILGEIIAKANEGQG